MFKTDFSCCFITDAVHHLPLRDPSEAASNCRFKCSIHLAKQNKDFFKLLTKKRWRPKSWKSLSYQAQVCMYRQVLITEHILEWKSRNFLFLENCGNHCTGEAGYSQKFLSAQFSLELLVGAQAALHLSWFCACHQKVAERPLWFLRTS